MGAYPYDTGRPRVYPVMCMHVGSSLGCSDNISAITAHGPSPRKGDQTSARVRPLLCSKSSSKFAIILRAPDFLLPWTPHDIT